MTRILSVSYDQALLSSRELLLESRGYEVISTPRFSEALDQCNQGAKFDLFIIGHSIPSPEKQILVSAFRACSRAPIIALKRFGEEPTNADFQIEPDPSELLEVVSTIASSNAASA